MLVYNDEGISLVKSFERKTGIEGIKFWVMFQITTTQFINDPLAIFISHMNQRFNKNFKIMYFFH